MKWHKIEIKACTKDTDMISMLLMEMGICDVQIEDNIMLSDEELNSMYADIVKEMPPDEGDCSLIFYLDEDMCIPGEPAGTGDSPSVSKGEHIDLNALEDILKNAENDFGTDPVTLSVTDINTEDWENNWKEYFKPFEVDGIVIKPTWEDVPQGSGGKVIINIDPGMAFGTGLHETTRLCLKGLKKYMKKQDAVLDLGCGSGILGIAAIKLGAGFVKAVDIDEQALNTAQENYKINIDDEIYSGNNIKQNKNDAVYKLYAGDIINDDELAKNLAHDKYDVVLANILAEVIVKLLPNVSMFMHEGSYFVASGILNEKERLVLDALSQTDGLEFVETVKDGEWTSVVARKKY